ncbi:hypothetical protein BgiBS90_009050 [Biomphalaria glabrata]|nr:hypothetical protein BgiBS90_009050 [Biomphalaria glabrata]
MRHAIKELEGVKVRTPRNRLESPVLWAPGAKCAKGEEHLIWMAPSGWARAAGGNNDWKMDWGVKDFVIPIMFVGGGRNGIVNTAYGQHKANI